MPKLLSYGLLETIQVNRLRRQERSDPSTSTGV